MTFNRLARSPMNEACLSLHLLGAGPLCPAMPPLFGLVGYGGGGEAGMLKVNRVSPPADDTDSEPPWARAISDAM